MNSLFQSELQALISALPTEIQSELTQLIEQEKELSWSNGYADACEQNGID